MRLIKSSDFFLYQKKSFISKIRLSFLLIAGVFASAKLSAQATTNGGSGLATNYASLSAAISALNAATITAPVTITLTGPETAPALDGYKITAIGTATNTIVINGGGNTVTAGAQAAGGFTDAIFKIVGGSYITINNFVMQENAANTVTAVGASNTTTEFGVGIFYSTTTTGSSHITISGNTISLNKNSQNSIGVYVTSCHLYNATALASATGAAGANQSITISGNTISNVNNGIYVVGPSAFSDYDDNLFIYNNSISNFGSVGAISGYGNIVTGFVNGILLKNIIGASIYGNTITGATGITTGGVIGIHVPAYTNVPTTGTLNIYSNKIINLENDGTAATNYVYGINIVSGFTNNIYNNVIGDLRAPNNIASFRGSEALRGISILSTVTSSTQNVSYNTIRLSGSGPSNFTTAALSHTYVAGAANSALVLRNNILINKSTPAAVTTATATATFPLALGTSCITVNSGGSGYNANKATVSFSGGGGTGAAATASVSGGIVTSINVTNVGTGYTSAPTVTILTGSYTIALSRSAATDYNNYSTSSNNNIFYAGTPSNANYIFMNGSQNQQTFAGFQALSGMSPRETASFTEDVSFQSTTSSDANFLRIANGTRSAAESGANNSGLTPSITTDFWGITRPFPSPLSGGTATDIGASEFDGYTLSTPVAFYVSPTGDDNNTGYITSPLKTLTKALTSVKSAGDAITLRAGTYRETGTITTNGISIKAYPGETAIISGTDVTNLTWTATTVNGVSVYSAPYSGAAFEQLFMNGKPMVQARWPNLPTDANGNWNFWSPNMWANADGGGTIGGSGPYTLTLTSTSLANSGLDATGALAVLNVNHQYYTWTRTVLSHGAGSNTLTYAADLGTTVLNATTPPTLANSIPWNDDRFYLVGKLSFLDSPGEWYYDQTAGTLYFYPPNGLNPNIVAPEIKSRNFGLAANNVTNLDIENLTFYGTAFKFTFSGLAVNTGCSGLTFKNNNVQYSSWTEYLASDAAAGQPGNGYDANFPNIFGSNCNIIGNTFSYGMLSALYIGGANNTIENNIMHDFNYSSSLQYPLLQLTKNWSYYSGPGIAGNASVRFNDLYNSGGVILSIGQINNDIAFNHVYNGFLSCYGGNIDHSLIYSSDIYQNGSQIHHNWVHDGYAGTITSAWGRGIGIRGDDNTSGLLVYHNVIWNVGSAGIYMKSVQNQASSDVNTGINNTIFRNSTLNPQQSAILFEATSSTSYAENTLSTIYNNVGLGIYGPQYGDPISAPGLSSNNYNNADLPLVDTASYDFRPTASSALVNTGKSNGTPYDDQVTDGQPDEGAYERGILYYWIPGFRSSKASFPIIPNGASSVTTTRDKLMFRPAYKATSHKIYFGTSASSLTLQSTTGDGEANVFSLPSLTAGTTYYWRVDAVMSSGTVTGDIWSFTTAGACIWNDAGWTTTPDASKDAVINSNNAPASFSCKSITINTTKALNITVGNTATIYGDITNVGNGIIGGGNFTIAANSSIISNIPVYAVISVNSGVSLNTNGLLTLSSNSSGTASIAQGSGSYLTGNVTVQRYVGSSQIWRMVGLPFTAATTISEITLSGFYISGYGAYTYNENSDNGNYGNSGSVNGGWAAFNSGTISSAKGILLSGGSISQTINFTGPVNTGTQTITLGYSGSNTNKGWNLIANPFASNINWTTIQANNTSNLDNAIYRYDPNTTAYASYVNGLNAGNQSNIIENGAGFFVHSTGATSLSIQETDKTATGPMASLFGVQPNISQDKSIIKLALLQQGETYGDEVVVRWGVDPATDGFDGKYDAYDIGRTTGADLSVIGGDGIKYSIFHGSPLQTKDREQREIALGIKNLGLGNYSINATLLSAMYAGNDVFLIDHYSNQTTLISIDSAFYHFNVTSDPNSASSSRFSIALNYKPKIDVVSNEVLLWNNPSTINQFEVVMGADYQTVNWQLVDINGRVIQSGIFNGVSKGVVNIASTRNISSGTYFIKLMANGKLLPTQKWIKY